tara:strand:+ start:1126 stop:1296 length:171 start_codon:yes stop_codon:yes gene_type:complete
LLKVLLVLSKSIDKNKDSAKTVYFYNDKRLKIKEEYYTYKKRMKKNSDKGFGRPGG